MGLPSAQLVKNPPVVRRPGFHLLGWEDSLEIYPQKSYPLQYGEYHGLYSLWGYKESDSSFFIIYHQKDDKAQKDIKNISILTQDLNQYSCN